MSAESESFVDVTYRGLAIAKKAKFREGDGGGFVEFETPLPVGSALAIVSGDSPREGKVIGVVEHEAGAKSPPGMKIAWTGAKHEAAPAPTPAAAAAAPVEEAAPSAEDGTPTAIEPEMSGGTGEKKGKRGKKKNGR
jgi:hypothetical protein